MMMTITIASRALRSRWTLALKRVTCMLLAAMPWLSIATTCKTLDIDHDEE